MSRDQLVAALLSVGAISLIQIIEDVEAGRIRRIRLEPLAGQPALTREVLELLRSLGADVELPLPSSRSSLRRAG